MSPTSEPLGFVQQVHYKPDDLPVGLTNNVTALKEYSATTI